MLDLVKAGRYAEATRRIYYKKMLAFDWVDHLRNAEIAACKPGIAQSTC